VPGGVLPPVYLFNEGFIMKRTRSFTRKMRAKHIRRKKSITRNYHAWDEYPYYQHDGMYSKGKVHCSCPLCKEKAYIGKHPLTRQEKIALLKLKEEAMAVNLDEPTSFLPGE
jgi:hypothetical protein